MVARHLFFSVHNLVSLFYSLVLLQGHVLVDRRCCESHTKPFVLLFFLPTKKCVTIVEMDSLTRKLYNNNNNNLILIMRKLTCEYDQMRRI